MVSLVLATIVVAGALIAFMLVRVRSHGGWGPAFSPELKEGRIALANARSEVKRLSKARSSEMASVEQALSQAVQEHDKRVATATAEVAYLEDPREGRFVASYGGVEVFDHAVRFEGNLVPILGLRARVESTATSSHLYLDVPSGQSLHRSFNIEWHEHGKEKVDVTNHGEYDRITVSQKMRQDYSDEGVRGLANKINNAAVAEATFVVERPSMLIEARKRLAEAQADTHAVDAAAIQRDSISTGSAIADQLAGARTALSEIEARWAKETSARTVGV